MSFLRCTYRTYSIVACRPTSGHAANLVDHLHDIHNYARQHLKLASDRMRTPSDVCYTVVSALVYPLCHGVQVTTDSVHPLSLQYTKQHLYKVYKSFLSMKTYAAGYALTYITTLNCVSKSSSIVTCVPVAKETCLSTAT
jgi:hypothetical protein